MWILVLFVVTWSIILINEGKRRRDIMAAIDNLKTAVTGLQSEVALDLAALQNLPSNDTAIQAAADAVNAETAKLVAARATLTPAA